MTIADLPLLNACLNGISTIFLIAGYYFIKRKNITSHRKCMITAFTASCLFLVSYLFYHYHAGSVKFAGTGTLRSVYFTILISHSILAATVPFLAVITLRRGLALYVEKHRRIARWTLPIWLYVSATGVAIYLMLYRL